MTDVPPQRSGIRGFTVRENLNMSPIEKHIHYNKISWRLIFNIILVTLVTAQVLFIFDDDVNYSREEQRSFRNLFLAGQDDDDHTPVVSFNLPADLQTHFSTVQDIIMNINDYVFQDVTIDNATLSMQVQHHYGIPDSYNGKLSDGFNGNPYFQVDDIQSIKTFLQNTVEMEIVLSGMRVFNEKKKRNVKFCQDWTIILDYDAKRVYQVDLTVDSKSYLCGVDNADVESTHLAMSFLVIVFSVASLYLSVQKLKTISRMFSRLKAGYNTYAQAGMNRSGDIDQPERIQSETEEEDPGSPTSRNRLKTYLAYNTWEDIPISAKLKLLSPWFFFNTLGNIFQFISSVSIILTYYLPDTPQSFYNSNVTLGCSIFFSWTLILQYLTYWKDVTLITTTLDKASSNIIIFFGIVFPLFIGFAILGYSLFWKYDKFNGLAISARSLFSMAGGDIVHETFLDTWDEGLISTVFFIGFMVIFYTAFVNIFVVVIMEGYDKGKMMKQLDNDDPFKSPDNLTRKDANNASLLGIDNNIGEHLLKETNTGYNLKDKIEKKMTNQLDAPVKNVLSTLMNQQEQAKARVAYLLRVRKALYGAEYDPITTKFLMDTISSSINRLLNKIFYIRSGLKSKPLDAKGKHSWF